MFTERQLRILDEIDPYIDGQEGESRKGQAQMFPLIEVRKTDSYFCTDCYETLDVPSELVGYWICTELVSEDYYDTWHKLRGFNWKRAEQVEVTITKWRACDDNQ